MPMAGKSLARRSQATNDCAVGLDAPRHDTRYTGVSAAADAAKTVEEAAAEGAETAGRCIFRADGADCPAGGLPFPQFDSIAGGSGAETVSA
jgi:hypothetical protein